MGGMTKEQEKSIGVDVGGTSVKIAVVEGREVVEKGEAIATSGYGTAEGLVAEIVWRVKGLQAKYPEVKAVGIGLPGFVDHERGVVDSLTNVAGWHNVPICAMVREECGLPTVADNDANCMAYGEWKLGAGRGMRDLVCLTLGTGVGAGVIANGQMVRGHLGAAGELGQVSIDYRGRIGHYGNRGAVEDYIGNNEIMRDARILYATSENPREDMEKLTPIVLENAAKSGCGIAAGLWEDVATKLATCMLSCYYILNPQAFIIGGGMANAGDLLFSPLRRQLRAQIYPPHFERLQILPAQLRSDAGVIGAARLALDATDRT